jgi:hypothetical protein
LKSLRAKIKVGIKLRPNIKKKQKAAERIIGVKSLENYSLMFNGNKDLYSIQDHENNISM